jgi:hypothetical protein
MIKRTQVLIRRACWMCDGTGEGPPRHYCRSPKCDACKDGWIEEWEDLEDVISLGEGK